MKFLHPSSQIASASIVISRMLLTTMPPLSMVSFQLTPKSCRLIEVFATKSARVFGPLKIGAAFPPRQLCHCRPRTRGRCVRSTLLLMPHQFNCLIRHDDAGAIQRVLDFFAQLFTDGDVYARVAQPDLEL